MKKTGPHPKRSPTGKVVEMGPPETGRRSKTPPWGGEPRTENKHNLDVLPRHAGSEPTAGHVARGPAPGGAPERRLPRGEPEGRGEQRLPLRAHAPPRCSGAWAASAVKPGPDRESLEKQQQQRHGREGAPSTTRRSGPSLELANLGPSLPPPPPTRLSTDSDYQKEKLKKQSHLKLHHKE